MQSNRFVHVLVGVAIPPLATLTAVLAHILIETLPLLDAYLKAGR